MKNSVRVLLLALLTIGASSNFSASGQEVGLGKTVGENGVFQQLKQANDGSFNIGNFDDSRILDAKNNALTTVTIRDGRIDFTKRTEQTRQSLLQLLYEKGVRMVYLSVKDQLTLTPQGRIGSPAGNNGIFQSLKESANGYSLDDWNGSDILDAKGDVLATVIVKSGQPNLAFTTNNSLKTLYQAGLRSFIDKPGSKISVEEDERGELKLNKN
ncbi:MAG: hypothetical protein ACXWID_18005 [Pyrinomonadaceae bacterium]